MDLNEALMVEKKIKGRKRHIATDAMGNLLYVKVHSAKSHDTISGSDICYQTFRHYSSIMTFSADAGYRGTTYDFVTQQLKMKMNIAIKEPHQFSILKKRWIVERTFAWLGNFRRLSKDFEVLTMVSENLIRIAMVTLAVKKMF
jgi:putative transposase